MENVTRDQSYHLLFEHNPLPMWVFDRETLRILEVNDAAVQQYGFDRDEFLGMTIRDIRPAEDLDALEADLRVAKGGYDPPTEWRHRRKDGGIFHVEIAAHDIDLLGRPARLVLAKDVTSRKMAEVEQDRLRRELEVHAANLEAMVAERTRELAETNAQLEAFAYSVSHDLRAPLRAMQGYSRILIEDFSEALGEEGRRYADRIVDAAGRMDTLIQSLLAYSRLAKADITLETVSLDAVVEAALSQLSADIAEKKADVVVEGPLGAARGHHDTLVQAVCNLLSNGMKFVPAERGPRVRVDAAREGEDVRLRVTDNGLGIDPQYQTRVFRIFERLHPSRDYAGTGIGLAIVAKGVERMGGRVELASTPGEGSTFSIVLPAE